jgi:hypothetical protein
VEKWKGTTAFFEVIFPASRDLFPFFFLCCSEYFREEYGHVREVKQRGCK